MGRKMTPMRAILQGLAAAAAGTAAMDMFLYSEHRLKGGNAGFLKWETAAGLDSWEKAPVPAQVGKRLVEGLLQRSLNSDRTRMMTNVMHWGYGMFWGAVYGVLAGSRRSHRSIYGLPFGLAVWSTAYLVLPPTGLYKKMWEYDTAVLVKDAGAHLVYGTTTAAVFKLLDRK